MKEVRGGRCKFRKIWVVVEVGPARFGKHSEDESMRLALVNERYVEYITDLYITRSIVIFTR